MLTYIYALVCNPCERTACDLFAYVEAHPGCLMALDPDDFEAVHRVMDVSSLDGKRRRLMAVDGLGAGGLILH
jgi:hypothetical protein